ncbi:MULTISPECIES: response regulator transcription factor [Desulfitobacterium]|uniref:Stage 0 sporulation protein A homolog n=1 Tax=Desulfitobacterium dehalogenans (strain ATCC 51507 / DSM 9161 / JW/IU-DC1) TaxID=756499 RepID=I4A561_DESDJ|nr:MULTISPECIES: response regulator transcription factor [Desulfitobacterium]AFL99095.1 response regulator with CheY-like receiver domain and winged-helix DNA-binding domain [Desulfitobacterium dehalogenans ATCC 51507]
MHRILLVEDDPTIAEIIQFYLAKNQEYHVQWVKNAQEALSAANEQVGAILLDIRLPGMDGMEICAQLRRRLYCPIIFISCLDDEETIVKALRLGGDDYLVKPFKCPVLLARIEANLRRMQRSNPRVEDMLYSGELALNTNTHTVQKGNDRVYLSPTEFQILYFLMRNKGIVLELEEIYYFIWQRPSYGDVRTVCVHVSNLRKKIEEDPLKPKYIKTVRKIGYMFND